MSAVSTVLIADDEVSMRLLIRTTIESDKRMVIEAGDGDEAWTKITQRRPSLVILDVQMPLRDGLEILAGMKSDPDLAGIKVIMLTARALAADVAKGIGAGADIYLTKPFSPLELVARVDDLLNPQVIPQA